MQVVFGGILGIFEMGRGSVVLVILGIKKTPWWGDFGGDYRARTCDLTNVNRTL